MKVYFSLCLCFFFFNIYAQQDSKERITADLDSICSSYIEQDKEVELLDFALKELTHIKAKYGDQDTLYGLMAYYAAMGYIYGDDNPTKGLEYYEIAAKIEKTKDSKLDYASTLNEIGDTYIYSLGDLDKGLGYYEKAKAILEKEGNVSSRVYITTLINISDFFAEKTDFITAEELLLEAKNIIEKAGEKNTHPKYADILGFLGNLYYRQGRFEEAKELQIEALKIIEKLFGTDTYQYKSGLEGLLMIYTDDKDYDSAGEVVEQLKNTKEGELPFDLSCINLVANYYAKVEKYTAADKLYKIEKKLIESTIGKKSIAYAQNLYFSGELYIAMSDYVQAEKNFKGANAIRLEHYGSNRHPHCLADLNKLICVYIGMNDLPKAKKTCLEAIYFNTGIQLNTPIKEGWGAAIVKNTDKHIFDEILPEVLESLYTILGKEAKVKEQQIVGDLAIQLIEKNRDKLTGKQDKLRLLSQLNNWVAKSLNVLDTNTQKEKAFEVAEIAKMALLLEASRSDDAYAFGDLPKELINKEKEMLKEHARLKAGVAEERPQNEKDSLLALLNDLNLERIAFKKEIKEKYPKYNALKYSTDRMTKVKLQKLLDDKTALLEYVIRPKGVDIFSITAKEIKWIYLPMDIALLNENIAKLHQVLSGYDMLVLNPKRSYQDYTLTAHWCYNNLLKTAVEKLDKSIENLIIVTDGKLGHLPFETFLVDEASQATTAYNELHYLFQDYKISYNYSAGLLFENKKQQKGKATKGMLAIAANYDWKVKQDLLKDRLASYLSQRKKLSPLKAARQEVELLSEKFAGDFALDGAANEQFFKQNAFQYDIIHLAMHGLLNAENPMLSSMAFTEDGNPSENNFLQAHEISKIKLNASLVVLSACETGYGKFETGNGIASLARSFMYAGASSLVVSLWSVNDVSTAHIMSQFYSNLQEGMDKPTALHAAKKYYLDNAEGLASHPAFWSPFILIGDTAAISVATKTNWLYWGLGIVGFVLFLLIGWKY